MVKTDDAAMTKHDLVVAYFPGERFTSAQRKFERWVNKNPTLLRELRKRGYSIYQRKLSHRQLHVIYRFLGEP